MPLLSTRDEPTAAPSIENRTWPPGQTELATWALRLTTSEYCPAAALTVVSVGARTVTLKLQLVVWPSGRMAVAVTVVGPTWKKEPEGGFTATTPQFPLRVGSGKVTIVPQNPGELVARMLPGQLSAQAWAQQDGSAVLIVKRQPPLIFPTSAPASSYTKSRHCPLGLVPLKTDSSCGSG